MTDGNIIAIIVALIVGAFSVYTNRKAAKKDDVDALRGIIAELKAYITDLEADKEDLQAWAEQLVCQLKDAEITPARFVRRGGQRTQPRTTE